MHTVPYKSDLIACYVQRQHGLASYSTRQRKVQTAKITEFTFLIWRPFVSDTPQAFALS